MHDKNGKSVDVGDRVSLTGTIVQTFPEAETCNIVVEQTDANGAPVQHTLCAKNVEKVEIADQADGQG